MNRLALFFALTLSFGTLQSLAEAREPAGEISINNVRVSDASSSTQDLTLSSVGDLSRFQSKIAQNDLACIRAQIDEYAKVQDMHDLDSIKIEVYHDGEPRIASLTSSGSALYSEKPEKFFGIKYGTYRKLELPIEVFKASDDKFPPKDQRRLRCRITSAQTIQLALNTPGSVAVERSLLEFYQLDREALSRGHLGSPSWMDVKSQLRAHCGIEEEGRIRKITKKQAFCLRKMWRSRYADLPLNEGAVSRYSQDKAAVPAAAEVDEASARVPTEGPVDPARSLK